MDAVAVAINAGQGTSIVVPTVMHAMSIAADSRIGGRNEMLWVQLPLQRLSGTRALWRAQRRLPCVLRRQVN